MFSISVGLPLLFIIIACSALCGFLFRSGQLKKSRKRILSLEEEMLQNHAEILNLQRKIVKDIPFSRNMSVVGFDDKSLKVPRKELDLNRSESKTGT
jgi:hypothetical protein